MRCGLRDGGAATCRNTRGLDHRVATGIALAREGAFDAEHAERFADPRVVELAATFGIEKSAADVFGDSHAALPWFFDGILPGSSSQTTV